MGQFILEMDLRGDHFVGWEYLFQNEYFKSKVPFGYDDVLFFIIR